MEATRLPTWLFALSLLASLTAAAEVTAQTPPTPALPTSAPSTPGATAAPAANAEPVAAPVPAPSADVVAPVATTEAVVVTAPVAEPAVAEPAAAVVEETPTKPTTEVIFGKGATIRSADDRVSLNIRGRIQARASFIDAANDGRDPITEMVMRRMRVVLQGNAAGPDLTYYIQLAFSNQDTESDLRLPLRDAYVTFAAARDMSLRFGQMKVPYGRQRVVSSSALQMVDRSLVTSELNLDRDVGLSLFSKDLFGLGGVLGYNVSVFGGDGRNRLGERYGYLTTARIEVLPFGAFDDFIEADFKRDPKPRLAIGAGVAYNQNTNRPRSTTGEPFEEGDFDYLHLGADLSFKVAGFSLQGELMYRKADANTRTVQIDDVDTLINARSAFGGYAQAGMMLTDKLELTARYGYLNPLSGNADAKLLQSHELGGGFSYYFSEHNLKLQGDYFYLPTDGWDNGAHQVRVQSQVFF